MGKSDNALVKITNQQGVGGFAAFMAYIGAVVYFFNQSPDFWGFILALIKAIAWPAFLIFHALKALGA